MQDKPNPVYKSSFLLNGNMIDYRNKIKLFDILSVTQEHGELHASELGFSMVDNAERDAFFVLMRQRIDIVKDPEPFTVINAETWPGNANRAIFPRFHRFFDSNGYLLISISTLWMLCSITNRQIIRDPSVMESMPVPIYEDLELPDKLRFTHEPDFSTEHVVAYSDLDCYGHANNRKYIEWCSDLFPLSKYDTRQITQFQINYVSEIKFGETVTLNLFENNISTLSNNTFSIEGIKKSDNKRAFLASGIWSKS